MLADLINELIRAADKTGNEYEPWLRPDCGSIKIGKDVMSGLYNPWNGAGSVLEIQFDKDIVVPVKYIRSALPDGKDPCGRWGINSIYCIPESAWKETVKKIMEAA